MNETGRLNLLALGATAQFGNVRFAVLFIGNGAGFGVYDTAAEAIERRDSLIAGDGNGSGHRFKIALVLP